MDFPIKYQNYMGKRVIGKKTRLLGPLFVQLRLDQGIKLMILIRL